MNKPAITLIKKIGFSIATASMFLVGLTATGEAYFRHLAKKEAFDKVCSHQILGKEQYAVRSLIPGLDYVLKEPEIIGEKLNSWGYHDKEFVMPKPKDVFRIIFLGDSTTYGLYVNISDTFPRKLEDILNESKTKFDVINLAVKGYNSLNCYSTMKNIAIPYLEPDLIIYAFYAHNLMNTNINFHRNRLRYVNACYEKENVALPSLMDRMEFFLETNSSLYAEIKHREGILRYNKIYPMILSICKKNQENDAKPGNSEETALKKFTTKILKSIPYLIPHRSICRGYQSSYLATKSMAELAYKNDIKFMVMHVPTICALGRPCGQYTGLEFTESFSYINPDSHFYIPHKEIKDDMLMLGLTEKHLLASDIHLNPLGHELLANRLRKHLIENPILLTHGCLKPYASNQLYLN